MYIKIDNIFTLNQASGDRFDLVKPVIRKKADTGKEYFSEVIVGFSMSLESCLSNIIADRLKNKEETVNLSEFLKAYKKEKDQLLSLLDPDKKKKMVRTKRK